MSAETDKTERLWDLLGSLSSLTVGGTGWLLSYLSKQQEMGQFHPLCFMEQPQHKVEVEEGKKGGRISREAITSQDFYQQGAFQVASVCLSFYNSKSPSSTACRIGELGLQAWGSYFQGPSYPPNQGERRPQGQRCAHSQAGHLPSQTHSGPQDPGDPCPTGLVPAPRPSQGLWARVPVMSMRKNVSKLYLEKSAFFNKKPSMTERCSEVL